MIELLLVWQGSGLIEKSVLRYDELLFTARYMTENTTDKTLYYYGLI